MPDLERQTVEGFGREWSTFDQSEVPPAELARTFERYFEVFPWEALPPQATGFDLGCGSGRWARFVAPRVARLHCIDPRAVPGCLEPLSILFAHGSGPTGPRLRGRAGGPAGRSRGLRAIPYNLEAL